MTTREEAEMKDRAELSRLIQGGLNNGVAEYIADALIANGWCKFSLDDATVERVAESLYHADHGPWVSGHGFTPGGTPWGTSREQQLRIEYISKARAVLAAAVEAKP